MANLYCNRNKKTTSDPGIVALKLFKFLNLSQESYTYNTKWKNQ